MISIIIPSYGRPQQIKAAVENAKSNTMGSNQVIVVAEPEEFAQYSYILNETTSLMANDGPPSYGGAINSAIDEFDSDYYFMGADDLNFHRGWDVEALKAMEALPNIKVVGTNDLLNEYVLHGWHSTHSLVDRGYLDGPGGVVDGEAGVALYEGYHHNYVDTEFIGTAKARAVFAPCLTSVVEHNHHTVGKSKVDSTYEKGTRNLQEDHDLYMSRRELWWNLSK